MEKTTALQKVNTTPTIRRDGGFYATFAQLEVVLPKLGR